MVSFVPKDDSELAAAGNVGTGTGVEIVSSGQVLHVKVAGNLESMTGSVIAVAVDRQVRQHGRVCVLFEIHERDICTAIAMWQDEASNFKVRSINHEHLEEAKISLLKRVACPNNDSRI